MTFATLFLTLLAIPAAADTSEGPVLLDFHASWCGPCKQMRPVVQRLVDKGYPVKSIDVDRSQSLAARYKIHAVPTFVVVDANGRELDRVDGPQPAASLAAFFNRAKLQAHRASARPSDDEEALAADDSEDTGASDGDVPETSSDDRPRKSIPDPWKTVVRIHIKGAHAEGIGSGTIIYSTPEESIVLTCAHIFHIEGASQQAPPTQFPLAITVDLFDGELHGMKPAMVLPLETVAGKAIDYDFGTDVGLIRIRPGRRLPTSPVVPKTWVPRVGMGMTTVGCSEGRNATAWSTRITSTQFRGLVGKARYEAIECAYAPLQGRSGGGLYTLEGYVAGVCDFADGHNRRGLYASPRSIHRLLDKNALAICYNPKSSSPDRLLASRDRASSGGGTKLRAQNAAPQADTRRRITMPEPGLVGVRTPEIAAAAHDEDVVTETPSKGWTSPASARGKKGQTRTAVSVASRGRRPADVVQTERPDEDDSAPVQTEMQLEPGVNGEDVGPAPEPVTDATEPEPEPARKPLGNHGWRAVKPVRAASNGSAR